MEALQNETQWTNLQAFKAVADLGSFGQAATALGITHSTLRRRVDDLESWLNYPLLIRTKTGTQLTPAGEEIYRHVKDMAKLTKAIKLTPNPTNDVPAGTIKFHVENCLAPHLIAPKLPTFFEKYPDIRLLLTAADQTGDPGTTDVDVSLTADPPQSAEAVSRKVAVVNYACFASEEYLKENGEPATLQDMINHRTFNLVQYMPYLKALEPEVAQAMSFANHALQTDDMVTLVEATSAGGGISLLPSYYGDVYPELRVIKALPIIAVDLLMVYHIRSKERASIRVLTDWIRELFENDKSDHFGPTWKPVLVSNMQSVGNDRA